MAVKHVYNKLSFKHWDYIPENGNVEHNKERSFFTTIINYNAQENNIIQAQTLLFGSLMNKICPC